MKTGKTKGPKVGLNISFKHDGEWFHPFLRPVLLAEEGIRNPHDELVNGLYLSDLVATAQGDERSRGREGEVVYGWEVRYQDIHTVDLRDATRMAKTLRTIENRLAASARLVGRPLTFGQFALRGARAIRATEMIIRVQEDRRGDWAGSTYDDSEWKHFTLAEGQDFLDHRIELWRKGETFPLNALRGAA